MSDNLKDRLLDVAAATGPNEARQIALAAADRIEELEVKLAKAVEALRDIAGMDLIGASATAYNALRSIKGKPNE